MSGPSGSWNRGGRDRPDLVDHAARPTPTVTIAPGDRWPAALTGLIGLFLVAALLKPWADRALAPVAVAPPAPSPSTAPSAGPDSLAGLREHCQEPLGWRVYSREAWNDQTLRVWRSLEPASLAAGPLDPAIPAVPLGPTIEALGYCSPWTGVERPPAAIRVDAWRLGPANRGDDGASLLTLRAIAPDDPTPLGALYGPIGGRGDPADPSAQGWPAGRYVFAMHGPHWERWWAVDIAALDPPRPGGRTTPATTPGSPTP